MAVAYVALAFVYFFLWESQRVDRLLKQWPVVRYQGPKEYSYVELVDRPPPGWANLGEISRFAIGAVIVSEDWNFFSHDGVDFDELKDAIETDLRKRRFARGASTLTQQVVKNVFLTKDKSLIRKLKELYMATELEDQVPKRRILEVYFNIAEWGEGIYGIRAASRHYFSKSPGELTPKEAAFLAMLLPSPKRYSQSFRRKRLTPYARKQIKAILRKMTQAHYLDDERRAVEVSTPLGFEAS